MSKINQPSQGREVHENAGLGQERVDEAGPGPDQTGRSPTAGGPGSGGGDDAKTRAETERR